MSRKDFVLIANTIAALEFDAATKTKIANAFADELRATNGRFDRQRFIDACL